MVFTLCVWQLLLSVLLLLATGVLWPIVWWARWTRWAMGASSILMWYFDVMHLYNTCNDVDYIVQHGLSSLYLELLMSPLSIYML